jgi:DNA modification methylase
MSFYADDMVEFRHGDCLDPTDGLASLADRSIDVVITDPPYSAYVHQKSSRGLTADAAKLSAHRDLGFEHLTDDVRAAAAAHMARLVRRWVLVFSDFESAHLWRDDLEAVGLEYVRTGIWHKGNATPQFTGDRPAVPGEAIVICHPRGRKRWNGGGRQAWWPADFVPDELFIFEHNTVLDRRHDGLEARIHTTQKPRALMRELVRLFSDPGETILDPFAGVATTLRAAKDLDRKSIGWELQEKYCELGASRLGQGVLWQTPRQESLA